MQLDDKNDRYWQYLRFRGQTLPTLEEMLTDEVALRAYREDPFKPHTIARLRKGVYQKSVVLKYIDNLIDWAEYQFSVDTWESITEATLLYVLAYNILGGQPPAELEPCEIPPTKTYQDIHDEYGSGAAIPDFWIEVENEPLIRVHFSTMRTTIGNALPLDKRQILTPSILYFCVPENETLREYHKRVQDGLYKIRHGMNIAGIKRTLPLYEPPIDPMVLVRAVAAGGRDITSVIAEITRPLPHYRFTYLIERARSFAAQVQQFGGALLAALEKQDAEELALLRTSHEQALQEEVKKSRERQRDEAEKNLAVVQESKNSITTCHKHYQGLISRRLSSRENLHLASMLTGWYFDQMSNMMKMAASTAHLVPNAGSPFAMTYGGREIGASLSGVAEAFHMLASFSTLAGSMSSTLGGYERRQEEWQHQERLAKHDLDQVEHQLAAANLRWQIAAQDLANHEKLIEQSAKVYEFLRDKFTSRDLYRWIANQLAGLYFQAYKMANDLSKSAEKAFQYERNTDDSYIQFGHWDSLKKGLLAGERLLLQLNQLEKAYLDGNARTLEISKSVSLVQLDPREFFKLKANGSCTFNLTEQLFDFDFPGHYCRKIKSIAISIPAVVGPYESIKATLTQLSSQTILKPDQDAVRYLLTRQDPQPDQSVLRGDWRARDQIAISRGVNDSGLFELNFRDERYLPFEGSGAISSWRLDMPRANNRFDFDSISDVIIHLNYTALNGGSDFGKRVGEIYQAEDVFLSGHRILSMRHEFSAAWQRFMHPQPTEPHHEIRFDLSSKLFTPNLSNYRITRMYLKVDSGTFPLTEDLTLVVVPTAAGLTARVANFVLRNEDIAEQDVRNGQDAFDEWAITIDRSTIPPTLRKRDDNGQPIFEDIAGVPHFRLNPELVKNIALILVYEADIAWSGS